MGGKGRHGRSRALHCMVLILGEHAATCCNETPRKPLRTRHGKGTGFGIAGMGRVDFRSDASRSWGQRAREEIRRSRSGLAAPSCRKEWGYQWGHCVLPLGWGGMGSGAHPWGLGQLLHTCSAGQTFPGLCIAHGRGDAAGVPIHCWAGVSYPALGSPLPVMCSGEEACCSERLPMGRTQPIIQSTARPPIGERSPQSQRLPIVHAPTGLIFMGES